MTGRPVLVSVWQTWGYTLIVWFTYSYNTVLVSVWQTQWHSWISIASKYWTHAQPGMRPFVSLGWAYIFGCSLCENQKVQDSPRTKGWRFHVVLVWCPKCQSANPKKILISDRWKLPLEMLLDVKRKLLKHRPRQNLWNNFGLHYDFEIHWDNVRWNLD